MLIWSMRLPDLPHMCGRSATDGWVVALEQSLRYTEHAGLHELCTPVQDIDFTTNSNNRCMLSAMVTSGERLLACENRQTMY
jgi:hypothetical protein